VQTQLHFMCMSGNFWKGVVRLHWVAKLVAVGKRLKTTALKGTHTPFRNHWSMQ